jgi:hypothetical protein
VTNYVLSLEGYVARLVALIEKLREARSDRDDLELDECIDELVEEAEQAVAFIKGRNLG